MNWAWYAVLSAFFGALVAIFGKIGVRGVDSNLAVAFRTAIIVFFAWGIVALQGNASDLLRISRHSFLFLFLSAIATGLSWLFYYKALQLGEASRVAPIDRSMSLDPWRRTWWHSCARTPGCIALSSRRACRSDYLAAGTQSSSHLTSGGTLSCICRTNCLVARCGMRSGANG